mgnify:CR=1 FL=1
MSRSLGLATYLAYTRRTTAGSYTPMAQRPSGPLVWAHASDQTHVNALLQLLERMRGQRPVLQMLLTARHTYVDDKAAGWDHVHPEGLPADSLPVAERFLDHWRPDFLLWTGGDLHAALITAASERGIPMALIDIEEDNLGKPGWRWFPDLPDALLRCFDAIMVRDEATKRHLRRIGVPGARIAVTGALLDGAMPLPCVESDRSELSRILLGRPVWLAAMLHEDELDVVLAAHRQISRMALRAILVIVPRDPARTPVFRAGLEQSGLRFVTWSQDEIPEETTQVVLADTQGELGLWYRLAPISFMGSSLVSGAHGSDPNEPAAHGSAILYGPNIRRYLDSYSRFAQSGAARIVRDENTLASAVNSLIPPDKSAAMAHAAWEVASRSAALTDRIADLVQDRLDQQEAG